MTWGSGLSVHEQVLVRDVGFEAVGLVMGATTDALGYAGPGGCSRAAGQRGVAGTGPTATSAWVGYRPRIDAFYAARRRAVQRLSEQCLQVGGDGVVGVRLTQRPFPGMPQTWRVVVTGTAVRSHGRTRPTRPFLTDLGGSDFAALLRAHWVPCGIAFGVGIGVRHDDSQTWRSTRAWTTAEIPGYTELVHEVRRQVRAELHRDVHRQGGHGVVLQEMTMTVRQEACSSNGTDHIGQAMLLGTAIVPFSHRTRSREAPLQVLRLDELHERVRGTTLVDQTEGNPWQS